MLGDWAANGHGPLARRLAHALRVAINAGLLSSGVLLPPERGLASALAVSRSTVTAALDELRGDGLVVSRQGHGTRIVGPGTRALLGARVGMHYVDTGDGINLAVANPPDASHLPELSITTADLMAWGSGHGLEPLGLPALREAIARRHTAAGLMTEAGQIHVTNGAHHAIGVAIDALVAPGKPVIVDELNYPGLFDLLDHHRARTVGLASDAAGPDPHALERLLRRERPPVVFLQGGVVNPTGIVIGPARRRALAEVLDRHPDAVVVEDRTLVGLAFDDPPQPALASLCRRAPVITVESISKITLASLRVGWLRAPVPLLERLAQTRITTDLGTSVASQILTLQLLDRIDEIAAVRRATLRAIVGHATGRLRAELPEWSFDQPQGSSGIWVHLPIADSLPYTQVALRHGVQVAPGHVQIAGGEASPFLRVCVDRTQPFVDEGLDRLGRAWDEFTARRPRESA